jgi:hypothetical protein
VSLRSTGHHGLAEPSKGRTELAQTKRVLVYHHEMLDEKINGILGIAPPNGRIAFGVIDIR